MKRNLNEVVILSANRTPIGSFRSSLKQVSAVNLGITASISAIKNSGISPKDVEEVYFGHVLQAGSKQGSARQIGIGAGCPTTTEATTINKLCASGLKSVILASQSLRLGDTKIILAGGTESMSNVPFILPRDEPKYGGQEINDLITYDGLTCAFNNIHIAVCTEKLAQRYKITREDQDNYAISSYQKSTKAWNDGVYSSEIVHVGIVNPRTKTTSNITVDEEFSKLNTEKLLTLRPAFDKDGTITAGNSSKINDGAAALVLSTLQEAEGRNLKPLAKIISYADAACDPIDFGLAPAFSIEKALKIGNLKIENISLFEINEAFSAVPLVVMKHLNLNKDIVNIHGGAVSLGHPVGCSGARILGHLAHVLKKDEYGVAAICNGGGGSSAVVIQKM